MASLQEPGLLRLYKMVPNGNKDLLAQDRIEALAPAGGAPDGAAASVQTPEKWVVIDSDIVLVNDDLLLVTFEPDAADSIDASDCIWRIPLVTSAGTKTLGRDQFQNPALSDQALVASREVVVAAYKIIESSARLSGRIFLDLQDDT